MWNKSMCYGVEVYVWTTFCANQPFSWMVGRGGRSSSSTPSLRQGPCRRLWMWIACSSSPPVVNCHPVLLFPGWSCLVSRSNLATRRSCQRPTRPPRRCSRLAGYEGNAASMTLSVVKDFSDNLVDEEPHHLNPLAQNLHQNFKGGILMNRRNEMGGVRLERMQYRMWGGNQ